MELKEIMTNMESEINHLKEQWKNNKLDDYSKGYCSGLINILEQLKQVNQ